ncbi:hypothetical protein NG895_27340 [Aeoliella sp. ICT_H6.2]|uniref:LTXXQ motif family protein n=1 Tax=Aeoliella straminimaris TaxID=2954799 RepID=A0A9X2JJ99_9BACT|nr:hypothetical protein [Aeoliella straminimaris]MCO6047636.1 hypothetical protein [Aeoliella straminimaris]
MRRFVTGLVAVVAAVALTTDAGAQGRGGGRFGGGMGMRGGVQRGALLRLESVQEELEIDGSVVEEVTAAQREMRGGRGQGQRGNFRDMSPEEREAAMEEMRAARAEQQKKMNDKLAEILGVDRFERLNEIFVQTAGVAALQDPMVVEKLGITEEQTEEMQQVARDAMSGMREAFQSQDRDAIREKMEEIRADIEKDTMGVLSSDQKEKLEKMKGEPFKLSEEDQQALSGGRGGRARGGDAAPGGRGGRARGGRPQADE